MITIKPVAAANLLADVSASMRLLVPPLNESVAAAMARDEEFMWVTAAQEAERTAAIEERRIKVGSSLDSLSVSHAAA
jgi:hypothetical protein